MLPDVEKFADPDKMIIVAEQKEPQIQQKKHAEQTKELPRQSSAITGDDDDEWIKCLQSEIVHEDIEKEKVKKVMETASKPLEKKSVKVVLMKPDGQETMEEVEIDSHTDPRDMNEAVKKVLQKLLPKAKETPMTRIVARLCRQKSTDECIEEFETDVDNLNNIENFDEIIKNIPKTTIKRIKDPRGNIITRVIKEDPDGTKLVEESIDDPKTPAGHIDPVCEEIIRPKRFVPKFYDDNDDQDDGKVSISTCVKPEQLKSNVESIPIDDDNNQQQKYDQIIETISLDDDNMDNSKQESSNSTTTTVLDTDEKSFIQQQQQSKPVESNSGQLKEKMDEEIVIISDSPLEKSDNVSVAEKTASPDKQQQQQPSDESLSNMIVDESSQESSTTSKQYEPIDYSISSSPSKKSSITFLSRSMAMLRAVSNSFQTIGTSPSSMDKRESPKTASSGGGGGTQRASVMLSAAKENFTKSLGSKNVMEISPTKADNNNDSSNDDNNVDNLVVQPKKSILRLPSNGKFIIVQYH